MNHDESVENLSGIYGIVPEFYDISGNLHRTETEAKIRLLSSMGVDAHDEKSARESLEAAERKIQKQILEPVYVFFSGEEILIRAVFSGYYGNDFEFNLIFESGESKRVAAEMRNSYSEKIIFSESAVQVFSPAGCDVPEGYHRIELHAGSELLAAADLIVCPDSCFSPERMDEKLRGIAVQIYALNSENNAGIGDLGDLFKVCDYASGLNLNLVGVSPLHSLFTANRLHISPYSPSSRIFFNAAHISISEVPEGSLLPENEISELGEKVKAEKKNKIIDYNFVLSAKFSILEKMFELFYQNSYLKKDGRYLQFCEYEKKMGESLRLHSVYEALYEKYFNEGKYGCREWPADYFACGSESVKKFEIENQKRILYYKYIQWVFSGQLEAAVKKAENRNIRLYLDLAVGSVCDGSEVWSHPELYADGVSIGAPPDPFSPTGQRWGLCPPVPVKMKEESYASFRRLISSNMLPGGMIRLDHAMALARTFWVLDDKGTGAYVRYPMRDLIGILCLESRRKKCMVIGEDLGTVQEGFREEMQKRNIFSWKVLYFEKEQDGSFKNPAQYPASSIATVNTHDLPTLCGFLKGADIRLRNKLGIFSDEKAEEESAAREKDAERLLFLLKERENIDLAKDDSAGIIKAVHSLLNHSGSSIILYSLHDILQDAEQPNLPGTVKEYPNWSLRYPALCENFNLFSI